MQYPNIKLVILQTIKSLGGIYAIVNLITGDMYVGSAIVGRVGNRFHKHLFGGSGSKLVWAAVSKYGLANFAFVVLETVPTVESQEDNKDLLDREDHYISILTPTYNIAPKAGNTFGIKHTDETKAKMRLNYSSERREMIGSLNRGKSLPPSTIEALRLAAFNRSLSAESRAKVSANSTSANIYEISRVDNAEFMSSDGTIVTSLELVTLPVVAKFIGCGEKTVRRRLATTGIVKKIWHVKKLGKLNP